MAKSFSASDSMLEHIQAAESAIGVSFHDKTLLQRALTHRSYLNEFPEFPHADNERLEFLGDAVLGFLVAAYLYHRFPEQQEGYLTALRSVVVRRDTLAELARQSSLGIYLLMGHGEAESGGRERAATLSAAFEALIGALFLDQGLSAVEDFLLPAVDPVLESIQRQSHYKDPKSRLQELAQSSLQLTPHYQTVSAEGPDHKKIFTVEVVLGEEVYGVGVGQSKRKAEQLAAEQALERLEIEYRQRLRDDPPDNEMDEPPPA